ncbi:MAG: restriction endonuclease subunit S, partial [Acutalibacteraceae bacterium]|nr:restriction endonuclease subunit S [Acutalibacteraceae bacterium]
MKMTYYKLGNLCDVVSGGTPSRSKQEYWKNGTIPWVKISNIKGKYVSEVDEYITVDGLSNSSAKILVKGTIIYTIFATLGEVGILEMDACTNQAIAGITIKNDTIINRGYLYYYLKSKKNYVNNLGRGVAQNNINMSILRQFKVPTPAIEKQIAIVKTLEKVENILIKRKYQL